MANGTSGSVKSHNISTIPSISIPKNGYFYVYVSNESVYDVFFDNLQVIHTQGPILEETHYYPFGLTMAGISSKAAGGLENKFKYNAKEEQRNEFNDGSGLEWNDFGARMYDVQIARWNVLDPLAYVQVFVSPYIYALNSPLTYVDKDGKLPILINGRVANDNERQDKSYWDDGILSAISNSGIPNPGGTRLFVDGDRWYGKTTLSWKNKVRKGDWTNGNSSIQRTLAGYVSGKNDISTILSHLAKDLTTGKYTETIQIYTHSRGAAFGAGYIQAILEYVKEHPEEFADPKKVIDLVYNMAPHQSNSITEPGDLMAFSHDHTRDMLSGNDMGGLQAAFKSNETASGAIGSHSTTSFVNDINAFLNAFVSSKGNVDLLIQTFVSTMKKQYGITVKVPK